MQADGWHLSWKCISYLFQVKADFLLLLFYQRLAISPILFQAPKAFLSSLWQPSTALTQRKTDSRPIEEVCRQVEQNNNKTGVRARKGKRTDPNNGRAVAWHAYEKWQWTSHPLFIAVQSWVIYFFQQHEQQEIMAQNKQPVVAYSCDCQQTVRQAQWWRKLWLWLWPSIDTAPRTGFTLTGADSVSVPLIVSLPCRIHDEVSVNCGLVKTWCYDALTAALMKVLEYIQHIVCATLES